MAFAIAASFPLGTYRGHRGDGEVDPLPTPARLHAALLAAAAAGPRGEVLDEATGLTGPCTADGDALRWLEQNPPDGMLLPATERSDRSGRLRYRKMGTIGMQGAGKARAWSIHMAADRPEACVAMAGEVAWTWSSEPPATVRRALHDLTGDVSHLGTAESPVRMWVTDRTPNQWLDPDATVWGPPGVDVEIPLPGRLNALVESHRSFVQEKVRPQAHAATEGVLSPPLEERFLAPVRFRPCDEAPRPDVPWPLVLLRGLGRSVPVEHRVRAAVAAHRALIAIIGDGAPPLVTGHYADGAVRPANRIAIHVLDPGMPSEAVRDAESVLAVMVPRGADATEVDLLAEAMAELTSIRLTSDWNIRVTGQVRSHDGASFWSGLADGAPLWHTAVPALPDLRPPRGTPWTMDDSLALSVGLVWRDLLGLEPGRRPDRDGLLSLVRERGFRAVTAERVRAGDVTRYAHRVNEHAVITPIRATIDLGSLVPSTALVALGQSRHLGGGLLVPFPTEGA